MQKNIAEINLFFYSFIILFLIIWKTNSYIINGSEEDFLNSLIYSNNLTSIDNFIFQGNEEIENILEDFNYFPFTFV